MPYLKEASVILLAYLGFQTDWAKVAEAFAHLRWAYWIGAVALLFLAQE